MELLEAIFHRRAVRSYLPRPVSAFLVQELLRAATFAPSAVNQQPWAFLVVRGRTKLAEFSARAKAHLLASQPGALELYRQAEVITDPDANLFYGAGTLVVVYGKPSPYPAAENCCLAAQNLMLAAHGAGLGTCPIGFARPWLDLTEVKEELGVPPIYAAVMPIVVGWPAGLPGTASRLEPEIINWMKDPDDRRP